MYFHIPPILCLCVISCVLVWLPLLDDVCGGLELYFVFVLVVWYGALKNVVCVFGKFLRVTGQVLIASGSI